MPHPDEQHERAPDQWDSDVSVTEDTAREVVPWTTMDKDKAPKNFRAVPVRSDEAVEVPVAPVPKDSSALESATSSQESKQSSSEQMESQTPATPARKLAVKVNGPSKGKETS